MTITQVPPPTAAPPIGLRAKARIVAAPDGRGGTALPVLAGDGPLALRRLRPCGRQARVCLVGAMSAPLGGDVLGLSADVRDGAALRLQSAAATLALPGRTGEPAFYDTRLTVGDGAELRWLPEPLISVRGSDLRQTTRADLAPGARLVLREEQVLGRAGEPPGRLVTRLTVRRAGRPLLDQELRSGPGTPGWDGAAVLGGHRAVGQLLVVDAGFADRPVAARALGATASLTPLAGPAVLVGAVAPDALSLRRVLDSVLREMDAVL
ncbi:urease accessory protein [Streptomyces cinnamoneus]|uniref:Urease accessory protein UreD n=1 Tax=Streptomyces cinnamoneus TaxID=53446 RepID=A0A2G1XLJ2_STRCJ|nr:urease accessory protein UreD [Streptomyces cinnamoneus]PHQ52087.1 urease accessory protein [Streptomyces cinnamoneus]PPT16167.1 urease accessory protein UreD [Streptomyces cinnamoneus]